MKIAISTIAKNEEKNVKDFVKSCEEADVVSVLDTGSTDKTVKLLKKYNAFAGQSIIDPFDFSVARNKALELLPENIDVVVSIDMDERLRPNWRKALEECWKENTEAVSYRYIAEWQDKDKKIPSVVVWRSKIFKRKGFKWFNPIHEIPLPENGNPNLVQCEGVVVEHYQEGVRDYTEQLTKWLKECPDYKDGYIQRGSDYIRLEKYEKSIKDFEQYLEMTRNEKEELVKGKRANCYLDIARAKHKMKYPPNEIIELFLKAVAEAPNSREAWTYLADGYMSVGNYPMAYGAAMNALRINNPGIYAQEMICWGDYPKNIADTAFSKIMSGAV